jgi:hypothetical protein
MKTLSSFEFTAPVAKSSYDWDAILSGEIKQLEEGTDYACKTQTMRMLILKAAKKRGVAVRTNKVEGGLVVQAVPAEAGNAEGSGR